MSEPEDKKIIGGFRVLREIQAGSGSQGTVYKAVCEIDKFGIVKPGTVVALKVMAVQDDGKQHWRKLEARTFELRRMKHPNIVRYYGCFSESGLFNDIHVVVQEYLEGATLKEKLSGFRSGLDVDLALKVADDALAGLEYISRCGIVHRDIKPGNIFLCDDRSVKLIDFEIARQRDGTTTSTAGNIRGSFDYMAPDFIDPDFHGDEQSDVFSMGVVLHEALVGKTPYQRLEGAGKQANFAFLSRWSKALSDGSSPIYVSSRVKRLLAHATEVLEKALAPRREERYVNFSEFRKALKTVKFRYLPNGDKSYQILQFIGKGGFGEVFKARLRGTNQFVAIKHLLKSAYAERFYREAKIMKKLNDPCFVRLVDFFTMDVGNSREAFLVMAFLDGMPGSSLRDAIRGTSERLPMHDVLTAFERYAHGLSVMHASQIYHRDIKPSNLYYPANRVWVAAIMDLGIARDVNGTATHGQVPGTLDYMPPEVVLTDNRGDGGMDVYALGLCMYESLTGKTAYPRLPSGTASYPAFFERARNKERPNLSDKTVASDPELLGLIREMTELDPEKRINNAGIVSKRLRKILDDRFGGPRVPESIAPDDNEIAAPTVATRVIQDAETQATEAAQWNDNVRQDIEKERRRYNKKRFVSPALLLAATAAAAVGFFCWKPVLKYVQNRSAEAKAVSFYTGRISDCVLSDGRLHEGNYAELEKVQYPSSPAVVSALSEVFEKLGKTLVAAVRFNLNVEPPLTRRSRIKRARQLLNGKWARMLISPGEVEQLNREIDAVGAWCVSIVKNACAFPVWIDGSEISAGGSKVMTYEDGHPENGIVMRPGFKPIHLPKDIDGKVYEITEDVFTAKPVRFSLPVFNSDIRCELEGRVRNPGEAVELLPGYYECRYSRDTYKPQTVKFSVYANADVKVPGPAEWIHTDEFIAREKRIQADREKKLELERKRKEEAEARKAEEEKARKAEDEKRRAEEARRKAEEEQIRAEEARRKAEEERIRAEEARKKAPVEVVSPELESGVICLIDGTEIKAGMKLKPGGYSCVYRRSGYRDQAVSFEVKAGVVCLLPSPGPWQANPVRVEVPELSRDVVCRVDGVLVTGSLTLSPGDHSCVYSRLDYEDQTVKFKVYPATPASLPAPRGWTAGSGLKHLEDAEAAAKAGNWQKAEESIVLSAVEAPDNVRRKRKIEEAVANQAKVAEKREAAALYFEEGLYYDAAKYYCEAVDAGFVLSQEDLDNFTKAYSVSKKRLQTMIDRCHKDIALGKSPIRPLADLEKEMRELIGWNAKIRGRKSGTGR